MPGFLFQNINIQMYRFGLSILLLLVIVSCRKEGCTDINSASYDPGAKVNDGMCTYRYLRTVTIRNMDWYKDAYSPWDPDGSGPDLKFSIVKNYDQDVPYNDLVTETRYDVHNLPVTWDIPISGNKEYLQTEMYYFFRLVDVDREGEELIHEGSFNPQTDYIDGRITLTGSALNVVIELDYIEF